MPCRLPQALSVLKELGVPPTTRPMSAIRAWGRRYEPAAAVVRRVDRAREANLVESFKLVGIRPPGPHLARIGLATLIGTQSLDAPSPQTPPRRLRRVQEWL